MKEDAYPQTRGRDLNHVAWLYDPLIEILSFGRERRFRQLTIERMGISAVDRILDVGCGTGTLTMRIGAQLSPPGLVIGIDAAPKMITIARRKALSSGSVAKFAVGVSESLDFPDASFDLVVNSMFTHHIDTELKERSFREMRRVLTPGGKLLTADIDRPTTLWGAIMGWGGRFLLLQKELEDNLRGRLPTLMAEAGFIEIERVAHVYGLVSFFTARNGEGAANKKGEG